MKLLHDKGLLLRMYTQNIDGLERCKLDSNVLSYSLYAIITLFYVAQSEDEILRCNSSLKVSEYNI